MLLKNEYDIQFQFAQPTPVVAMLHLHQSILPQLLSGFELVVEHREADQQRTHIPSEFFFDLYGNRCTRFVAPIGLLQISGTTTVEVPDEPDPTPQDAKQLTVQALPTEVLPFLLPSRYCQVDQFGSIAQDLFGSIPEGWAKAAAIRDWVHEKIIFDYKSARPTKTAMDVFTERIGVCRDFQHLAITLSRCLNIPARYAAGFLGDIRYPYSGPGDFSAWYQVFLDGRWITMDARHNHPRFGRVLMATGRDAADVAITTSFGYAELKHFFVESNEIRADGSKVPLQTSPDNGCASTSTT